MSNSHLDDEFEEIIADQKEQIKTYQEVVNNFVRHKNSCRKKRRPWTNCSCGLDDALNKVTGIRNE